MTKRVEALSNFLHCRGLSMTKCCSVSYTEAFEMRIVIWRRDCCVAADRVSRPKWTTTFRIPCHTRGRATLLTFQVFPRATKHSQSCARLSDCRCCASLFDRETSQGRKRVVALSTRAARGYIYLRAYVLRASPSTHAPLNATLSWTRIRSARDCDGGSTTRSHARDNASLIFHIRQRSVYCCRPLHTLLSPSVTSGASASAVRTRRARSVGASSPIAAACTVVAHALRESKWSPRQSNRRG